MRHCRDLQQMNVCINRKLVLSWSRLHVAFPLEMNTDASYGRSTCRGLSQECLRRKYILKNRRSESSLEMGKLEARAKWSCDRQRQPEVMEVCEINQHFQLIAFQRLVLLEQLVSFA